MMPLRVTSACKPCATCTACCFCSTSKQGPTSVTPPINATAYLKGYSLERLRDLEMTRLTSEEALNGYYLHHSIQTLFRLIHEGFRGSGGDLLAQGNPQSHGFEIRPLDSRLFRPEAMPLLNKVMLRNHVLQRVIRLMSLSRPAKRRGGRRGRISYAQLGINQLGAVYEALLSLSRLLCGRRSVRGEESRRKRPTTWPMPGSLRLTN